MSQHIQTHAPNPAVKAPTRARRYANEPVPLTSYVMQGACGMALMMFIFWLAGFGS